MNLVHVEQVFSIPIYIVNNVEVISLKIIENCYSLCNQVIHRENNFYLSKKTNVLDNSDFFHLNFFINEHLKNYVGDVLGLDQDVYITNSFISIKKFEQSHHIHRHPNSFVSGVFYINCPTNSELFFHIRTPQVFSGFSNLRFKIKNKNIFNSEVFKVSVKKGDLILFPSHIAHSVRTNESNEDRIVVSFNSFIRGQLESRLDYCSDLSF